MSRQRSPSFILATELLLLVGGLFACSSQHDQNEDRRREMEAVERKIVLLDALVLARSGPVQGQMVHNGNLGHRNKNGQS